jgi:hypothetical protein
METICVWETSLQDLVWRKPRDWSEGNIWLGRKGRGKIAQNYAWLNGEEKPWATWIQTRPDSSPGIRQPCMLVDGMKFPLRADESYSLSW